MELLELERQMVRRLDSLCREFGHEFGPDYVESLGRHHYVRLKQGARVLDYIPLLVERSTRDDLRRSGYPTSRLGAAA